jgi:hypothetical protein
MSLLLSTIIVPRLKKVAILCYLKILNLHATYNKITFFKLTLYTSSIKVPFWKTNAQRYNEDTYFKKNTNISLYQNYCTFEKLRLIDVHISRDIRPTKARLFIWSELVIMKLDFVLMVGQWTEDTYWLWWLFQVASKPCNCKKFLCIYTGSLHLHKQ